MLDQGVAGVVSRCKRKPGTIGDVEKAVFPIGEVEQPQIERQLPPAKERASGNPILVLESPAAFAASR